MSGWFVYILRCADNTLYTGITTDLKRRLFEHNETKKGAKYTRCRRPCRLVYHSSWSGRSEAAKEEYKIKKLKRREKEMLLKDFLEMIEILNTKETECK